MNEFLPLLQDALITIGGALITMLAAFAVKAINSLSVRLRAETETLANADLRELTDDAIWRVEALAATTVTAIEQTTAKALREAVKAGSANPEDLKQLSMTAMTQIRDSLAPEYLEVISDAYGDVEQYILNVIEQKVWELKQTAPAKG